MNSEFSWKSAIRTLLLLSLLIALGMVFASQNTKLQAKLSVLEHKNQELEDKNKELKKEREAIMDSLHTTQLEISALEELEHDLSVRNDKLEAKIKNLKSKYETANNHSANYNTDSIQRYFSEFK